ncbi:MAG: metal-dependent transcriptional regulator [Chitinophagaceae bacterium]|nr:metal-dependent transcriptional regulator [Chitinophagaceae bacterium]MCB9044804.1 metal-dependent transcriptional regulator [Chitinophagales bacterium]
MQALTFTEENYIKAIYTISDRNDTGEVSVNEIAERVQTRPATVTDMFKKLSEKELIHYEKYKKVRLTNEGTQIALSILRKHRLWETFLCDKLNFAWDEVHEIAEQLEHIRSQKLIDRMDEYLGFPEYDPHGDPIPKQNGELPASKAVPLTEIPVNTTCVFVAVNDTSSAFLQQLKRFNLEIGTELNVTERMPYDNSVWVTNKNGDNFQLSEKISVNILVV